VNDDHFPLIQFYPGKESLSFELLSVALCFWFQYADSPQETGPFFTTSLVSLSLFSGSLVVTIEGEHR
jgi:hypothetical protein